MGIAVAYSLGHLQDEPRHDLLAVFEHILPHIEWKGMTIGIDISRLDTDAVIAACARDGGHRFADDDLSGFEWWKWPSLVGDHHDFPTWWRTPTRDVVSPTLCFFNLLREAHKPAKSDGPCLSSVPMRSPAVHWQRKSIALAEPASQQPMWRSGGRTIRDKTSMRYSPAGSGTTPP